MKKNLIIISLIIGAIIVGSVVGFGIYKALNKSPLTEEDNQTVIKDDAIDRAVASLNAVNDVIYNEENLSIKGNRNPNDFFVCYKYNKEDASEYVKKIKDIYVSIEDNGGLIEIEKAKDGKDALYVCRPKNCEVTDIGEYKIIEEDGEKSILVGEVKYGIQEQNGVWKFNNPIVYCKQ